jgi:hypothetical protein
MNKEAEGENNYWIERCSNPESCPVFFKCRIRVYLTQERWNNQEKTSRSEIGRGDLNLVLQATGFSGSEKKLPYTTPDA